MSKKKYENLGEVLRNMPKDKLANVLSQLSEEEAIDILYSWDIWKRPEQNYDLNWPEQLTMAMCGRG